MLPRVVTNYMPHNMIAVILLLLILFYFTMLSHIFVVWYNIDCFVILAILIYHL